MIKHVLRRLLGLDFEDDALMRSRRKYTWDMYNSDVNLLHKVGVEIPEEYVSDGRGQVRVAYETLPLDERRMRIVRLIRKAVDEGKLTPEQAK